MNIGYARISTHDQTLDLQKDALEKIECTKIFTDTLSGATFVRPGLEEALRYVREGDTLVVWRLDRLGRSLKHLIDTVAQLEQRRIGFRSLTENIDTTTSGGKLVFHVFGALAEFERDLIRERTRAGLHAARSRGRLGGRPRAKAFNNSNKISIAQSLYDGRQHSIDDICNTLHVSRATLYRYVTRRQQTAIDEYPLKKSG